MNVNDLAKFLGDACYGFLALNLFWGLFCAIVVWRRLAQLRFKNERHQAEFVDELNQHISQRAYEDVASACEADTRALPQLVYLALANRDLDGVEIRQLVAERLQRDVLAPLENRVNWIVTVIRNGPLLGLFGTVLGMMAAFGRIGTGVKVQPSQIADEISVALICTAMGLGTAIPLGYVASSLNIRIRGLQESLTPAIVRFLNVLKPSSG
ncbi:MAG: MotA/TolQ/ExbB proton channel family protein [Planctomycetia bacterium]|nr:MotA/TolQ/ExbB proton channel family protein [Planctomycetia bacterium]